MIKRVKSLIRPAYKSGIRLFKMVKNSLLNMIDTPVVVLLYHRVASPVSDPQLLAVSPENFRTHMKVLKDSFPVLGMDDNWNNASEPSVVVTFDDGYADNYQNALPILEEYGIPATFFITTGLIGHKRGYWWDELERIILLQDKVPEKFKLAINDYYAEWPAITTEDRHAIYKSTHRLLYRMGFQERELAFENIRNWADNISYGNMSESTGGRPMTCNEIKKLAQSNLAIIGSHGETHTRMYLLSPQEKKQEIIRSKSCLEKLTGLTVHHFSYPFGTSKDYDKSTILFLKESGYEKAAANFPGQWHRWTDTMQIPRHIIRNWDENKFIERLGGFWTE